MRSLRVYFQPYFVKNLFPGINSMLKIKCAVIGAGYLGRFHAQKYKMLESVDFIGVCDINPQMAENLADELNVPAYFNVQELLERVDAVSIAATTKSHYALARTCLEHGIHVLVEKPMTETVDQARELVALAHQHGVKLQVGHLERFNSARLALEPYLTEPVFIESSRLAPYNPRGADVNVILDLMIHDIDIIQNLVNSPIKTIDAHGVPVLTQAIDIANARITFENQCVANITASRVSFKTERKTRIFQPNNYISIDYQEKQFAIFEKSDRELFPGVADINRYQSSLEKGDALFEEIKAFVQCIINDTPPPVSGEAGLSALQTATIITERINAHLSRRYATI